MLYDTYMCRSFGTSSAQHQSYGRTMLAYLIHAPAHTFHGRRISLRIYAAGTGISRGSQKAGGDK